MSEKKKHSVNRRSFIKKAGTLSVAAAGLSGLPYVAQAEAANEEEVMERYWEKRQKKLENLEEMAKKEYKAFDAPPKHVYRGTDSIDTDPTFYAPLMQECPYLPEFQSIYTSGTAGQYFHYTLGFGMKDIIRFHGHSCEALYYTAAILRLICDVIFPNKVVDRSVLRGMGGKSP
jgi:hypothetical protein